MEYLFGKLKKLDVISVTDGKNLGKPCDIAFTLPEGKVNGFFATGCKGFKLSKEDVFIPLADLIKVGEDAILVKSGKPPKGDENCPPKHKKDCDRRPRQPEPPDCPPCGGKDGRRSYEEYE